MTTAHTNFALVVRRAHGGSNNNNNNTNIILPTAGLSLYAEAGLNILRCHLAWKEESEREWQRQRWKESARPRGRPKSRYNNSNNIIQYGNAQTPRKRSLSVRVLFIERPSAAVDYYYYYYCAPAGDVFIVYIVILLLLLYRLYYYIIYVFYTILVVYV